MGGRNNIDDYSLFILRLTKKKTKMFSKDAIVFLCTSFPFSIDPNKGTQKKKTCAWVIRQGKKKQVESNWTNENTYTHTHTHEVNPSLLQIKSCVTC